MDPKEEAGETLITIDAAGCDQYLCYLVVPNSLLRNLSKRAKDGSCLVSCVNEHDEPNRIPHYDGSYRHVEVTVSEEISRIVRTRISINNKSTMAKL